MESATQEKTLEPLLDSVLPDELIYILRLDIGRSRSAVYGFEVAAEPALTEAGNLDFNWSRPIHIKEPFGSGSIRRFGKKVVDLPRFENTRRMTPSVSRDTTEKWTIVGHGLQVSLRQTTIPNFHVFDHGSFEVTLGSADLPDDASCVKRGCNLVPRFRTVNGERRQVPTSIQRE